jgi:tRNA(Ile2)-agmatinylcytidine synthase
VQEIMPFMSGVINCKVISTPLTIKGGHVIFKIKDKFNKVLPVAVYQPTGLTKLVSLLHPGDRIEVGYGVHLKSENQLTLNLEYLIIKELVKTYEEKNPICNKCLKNMKSEGMNKGYQCKRCKSKNRSKEKLYIETERKIRCGLYIPEPIAHRHLTKPINRYGMEKSFDRLEILNIIKTIKWIEK